jgi:hypothetical protein
VRVEKDGTVKTDILYPLFFYRKYPEGYRWSVLQLINGAGSTDYLARNVPKERHFDVWPFYFSLETGNAGDDYKAFFPIEGQVKHRLGYQQLSWVLFPFYASATRGGSTVTYAPFPFVRRISGSQEGYALWPLFGRIQGPGVASHAFALWPLVWDNTVEPDPDGPKGALPGTQFGFLPFYTRETKAGYRDENVLWPFFGHTERTLPYRYNERRYFWPFLVQGHGDDHELERYAPFYTHSDIRGLESTWVGWPLWHNTTWTDGDVRQSKTQLFYFVYWNLDESLASRPSATHATKMHLWPLVSIWDNGAGSRQVQAPSPIEVFFPDNPDMRETWSPLFALYRRSESPGCESRTSLLWDALTWRAGQSGLEEFHLGPVIGMTRAATGSRWTILGFDLSRKPGKDTGGNR